MRQAHLYDHMIETAARAVVDVWRAECAGRPANALAAQADKLANLTFAYQRDILNWQLSFTSVNEDILDRAYTLFDRKGRK